MLVEFAAVFIVFMVVLWAIVTYGMVFAVNHSLSSAAAEAARGAIAAPSNPTGTADTVAADRLSWMGAAASHASVSSTVATCTGIPGDCITVEITYPYGSEPLIPSLGLLPLPTHLSSQSTVSLS